MLKILIHNSIFYYTEGINNVTTLNISEIIEVREKSLKNDSTWK